MSLIEETEGSKKILISHLREKTEKKLKCPLAQDIGEGRKGKMAVERLVAFEYISKILY